MSYLGLPFWECLPDLAYAHQPGFASSFILEGNSQKLLWERKVCVFKWWCPNALLAGHIQREGAGLSVLARLLPAQHNQHMCTWRQGSALLCLGQHVFGSKVDTEVLWGSNEVTLLRTLSHYTMFCMRGHQAMALFLVMDPIIDQFPLFALAAGKLSAKPACCLGHKMNSNGFL